MKEVVSVVAGKLPRNVVALVAVLVVFGGVGTYLLAQSHATTPVANVEAESGTISSAASSVADTTASGSQAVKFGVSGGAGVKPTATNTGVPAGIALHALTANENHGCWNWDASTQDLNVITNGCVVDGVDDPGDVVVTASNVTIKNSKIHNTAGGGYPANQTAYFAIDADNATNLTIQDSDLSGGEYCIRGPSFTYTRVNAHHCSHTAQVTGTATIQNSYLHDLVGVPADHTDMVQEVNATGIVSYLNNNLDMTNGGPGPTFVLSMGDSSHGNRVITGNWITGGNYTILVDIGAGNTATIHNNRFGNTYQLGIMDGVTGTVDWANNVWDDNGRAIPLGCEVEGPTLYQGC